jgi:azurin
VQLPTGFHVHQNGIRVTFSEPVDRRIAEDTASHFAQCWNYRYSAAYGSAELSTSHPGVRGHDVLTVSAVHVAADHRTVFLEIPDLQPVSQLYVRLHVNAENNAANSSGHDLFVTVNQMDEPFTEYPGYSPQEKLIAAHPLLTDMKTNAISVPNPWQKPIEGARELALETGKNLTYQTRELRVKRGEALRLTLSNPDVVPHNWALVQPGALRSVGELANRLISDPEAVGRHYIPKTDLVISYTDVVPPGEKFTISFNAPGTPGTYPFLCTFPGHWMVMNGVMIVE